MDRQFWLQAWGMVSKDLRQWRRDRQAALAPLLLPLVLMLISGVLFGFGGDAWPVGLVVESDSEAARQLAQLIESSMSNISPYFQIVTRDAVEARQLAEAGRLHMAITIPEAFADQLAEGETAVIHTQVFNINSDMTKNVRLRLDRVLQDFLAQRGETAVTVQQITTRDQDVWRKAFIAGGAVVVALLVGASLNTAVMMAREWERQTVKEVQLAPTAVGATVVGKLVAGLVATAVNVLVALLFAVVLFGLRVPLSRWPVLFLIGFGIAVVAAGLGLAAGAFFRDYRVVQPLLVVLAVGSFFAAGGFSSVTTLPPLVRHFAVFWPPAYAFEAMQWVMHAATPLAWGAGAWFVLGATAVASVCLGYFTVRRALYYSSEPKTAVNLQP